MPGSARSTQPPSPTLAVASKSSRSSVCVSILYGDLLNRRDATVGGVTDDPVVVGKVVGEQRVFVEQQHPVFFSFRISVSFSRREIALIAASRSSARLRLVSILALIFPDLCVLSADPARLREMRGSN